MGIFNLVIGRGIRGNHGNSNAPSISLYEPVDIDTMLVYTIEMCNPSIALLPIPC